MASGKWEAKIDPCELSRFGIGFDHEYEPGEFCWTWIARDVRWEHVGVILAAPLLAEKNAQLEAEKAELLAVCKSALDKRNTVA